MIEIKDLYKSYKMGKQEVEVLKGLNVHIGKNEFTSILGASGSGKSTLMNILGCLDVMSSGKYILDGRDIDGLSDDELADVRNKKIGFVFQKFNLLDKLTAIENVELPLIYQGASAKERRERSEYALNSLGLGDRLHHKPLELSGGQQQRVAIARAIVTQAPIILADEPTGNLDSKSGSEVMDIFRELHEQGNTILVITHDNKIASQTKRIIKIQDGTITEDWGESL